MMKQLPEWTFEPNDIHGRNLSEMYSQIRTQYLRYMNHVATTWAARTSTIKP